MTRHTTQHPIAPSVDLRDMLRQHLIDRAVACMEQAGERRRHAVEIGEIDTYQAEIRQTVRNFYGSLPTGTGSPPVETTIVSQYEKMGYRLENILFDSFPGWQVNATIYVPLDYDPPYPAVIIPVGHSGKQFESYQLPAQFFARAGYLAVVFDPPGQASEKQPGNDHFIDGVRCYLVGESSSRYFVADALRCIDYLETRDDVDLSHGVAMTGVSGGGTTTIFAALLDDRIAVTGPSCCVSPRADLDIVQCYAGCPETHMWRRYAEGIDEIDLLCAAAPTPTLLMAGEYDEVFHIEDTQRLAAEVGTFYAASGHDKQFEFFVDTSGHAYTLNQARRFSAFMNRWLRHDPNRLMPDLPDPRFTLNPYEELRCYPNTRINMRTLTLERAVQLRNERDTSTGTVRAAAMQIANVDAMPPEPRAKTGERFQVWTHHWQQILLQPADSIELPATFVCGMARPTSALLHFDDQHRNRLLESNGPLMRAIRLLQDRQGDSRFSLFTVDLRGWGDSAPALYPYDLPGWGNRTRIMAYMSAALGDSLMAQRIRDGLAALAYLRARPEVDSRRILVSGSGLGGVVALHVAHIAPEVRAVVTWDCLTQFEDLLTVEHYSWPDDAFIPQVLRHYDLPELAAALPCPARLLRPLDGQGNLATVTAIEALNARSGAKLYWQGGDIPTILQEHLQ